MRISVLTYNLLFNQALTPLKDLIKKYRPDIICLQEVLTDEDNLNQLVFNSYKLADFSNSFIKAHDIFGIATYYNSKRLIFDESDIYNLPRSWLEAFLVFFRGSNDPRNVLKTEFKTKNGKKIAIYVVHLTPWATAKAKLRQIRETIDVFKSDYSTPTIITGDFNYPYGRKQFEKLINEAGLKESTNNIVHTLEAHYFKFFNIRFKLDYVLYKKVKHIRTERLPYRFSDHYPILATFEV